MKKLTQAEIAAHLDIDQSAVSRMLSKLGLDVQTSGLDIIRKKYISHLREIAAGHVSPDGDSLVAERVLTERVDRELKQLTLMEKKGLLVNAEQLEHEFTQMVASFRTDLLSRDDQLKTSIDTLYGIDLDVTILNDFTYATLEQLAGYDTSQSSIDQAGTEDVAPTGADDNGGMGS
jgi:hypothetical protein